jgi:hypothetical protein
MSDDEQRKMITKVPLFSGKDEDYEDWREAIEDWLIINEGVKYQALLIKSSLQGEAWQLVKMIDRGK